VAKVIHILGVICGFAAGAILLVAGIVQAISGNPVGGKLIVWGIAGLAGASIATADGARAFPQLGIWKIGAKFEGLGDLATLVIFLIMAGAVGITVALS
jgi:hypothetical protein